MSQILLDGATKWRDKVCADRLIGVYRLCTGRALASGHAALHLIRESCNRGADRVFRL